MDFAVEMNMCIPKLFDKIISADMGLAKDVESSLPGTIYLQTVVQYMSEEDSGLKKKNALSNQWVT